MVKSFQKFHVKLKDLMTKHGTSFKRFEAPSYVLERPPITQILCTERFVCIHSLTVHMTFVVSGM